MAISTITRLTLYEEGECMYTNINKSESRRPSKSGLKISLEIVRVGVVG